MKIKLITGGAGFIGSNLLDYISKEKNIQIKILDNLSNGDKKFLEKYKDKKNIKFYHIDIIKTKIKKYFKSVNVCYHLSANSDISLSSKSTEIDFKQTLICTYNVLEAIRNKKVKKIIFTSGSGVYGDLKSLSPHEKYGPLLPISLYGATKLGAESLISAYASLFNIQAYIFRFANVVGPNQTHGVAFDFIKKLQKNPKKLVVLGNGLQSKSYIHVEDVIKAMMIAQHNSKEKINIFNVGTGDYINVREIASIVIKEMKLKNVKVYFGKEKIGWKGDVPVVRFSTQKIKKLGWENSYTSREAVTLAVRAMLAGQIK